MQVVIYLEVQELEEALQQHRVHHFLALKQLLLQQACLDQEQIQHLLKVHLVYLVQAIHLKISQVFQEEELNQQEHHSLVANKQPNKLLKTAFLEDQLQQLELPYLVVLSLQHNKHHYLDNKHNNSKLLFSAERISNNRNLVQYLEGLLNNNKAHLYLDNPKFNNNNNSQVKISFK